MSQNTFSSLLLMELSKNCKTWSPNKQEGILVKKNSLITTSIKINADEQRINVQESHHNVYSLKSSHLSQVYNHLFGVEQNKLNKSLLKSYNKIQFENQTDGHVYSFSDFHISLEI